MSDVEVVIGIIIGLAVVIGVVSYIKSRKSRKSRGPIMSNPLPPSPAEFRRNKQFK